MRPLRQHDSRLTMRATLALVAICFVFLASVALAYWPSDIAVSEQIEVAADYDTSGVAEGQPMPERSTGLIFKRCGVLRSNCVVDGDTFWQNGIKIRIADIDTPEISQPQCSYEKALGERATNRLVELLNEGPFELVVIGTRDQDQYGRKLRVVTRQNESLGDQLVQERLARTWTGRREPWC